MHRLLAATAATAVTITAALAALAPLAARAQEAAPQEGAPSEQAAAEAPESPPWYSAITVNGLVDGFYQVRVDAAQDEPLALRAFDGAAGFSLAYAELSLAMAPAPAGFRLDLGFGTAADAIDLATAFSAGTTGSTVGHYVQQAYAAMKLGPAEVNFGRFATSAGAEVVEAKDDWLYSRSLLFWLQPVTHTGVRVSYPLLPSLVLTAGVNNGWDAVSTTYAGKTGQLSLAWTGSSATAAATLYLGNNPTLWSGAPNDEGELRTFVDLVAATALGPVSLLANFDYASEAGADWWGLSVAARYPLPGDLARLSARGEFVRDAQGARFATGVETDVWEGTLGLSVPVGTSSELRVEARYDHASQPVFSAGEPSDDQLTGTVAALAWF